MIILAGLILVAILIATVFTICSQIRYARAFREETQRMVKEIENGTWDGDWQGDLW